MTERIYKVSTFVLIILITITTGVLIHNTTQLEKVKNENYILKDVIKSQSNKRLETMSTYLYKKIRLLQDTVTIISYDVYDDKFGLSNGLSVPSWSVITGIRSPDINKIN